MFCIPPLYSISLSHAAFISLVGALHLVFHPKRSKIKIDVAGAGNSKKKQLDAQENPIYIFAFARAVRQINPGKARPSSSSKNAPPPVLTCVMESLYFFVAAAVSPPPTILTS